MDKSSKKVAEDRIQNTEGSWAVKGRRGTITMATTRVEGIGVQSLVDRHVCNGKLTSFQSIHVFSLKKWRMFSENEGERWRCYGLRRVGKV